EAIAPTREAPRDAREAPTRPQVPHVGQDSPRRVYRMARRERRPFPMRHLRESPLLLAPALPLPPPTPRGQLQLHLFRLPLPAHPPPPPPPPAVHLARGEILRRGSDTRNRETRVVPQLVGRAPEVSAGTGTVGMGVNRLLTKSGDIPESWQHRLDLLLGTSAWRDEF